MPFLLILIAAFCMSAPCPVGADTTSQKILILNSYHQGYTWTDQEVTGILEALQRELPGTQPFMEYMDRKRFTDDAHLQRLRGKYRSQFRKSGIGVVIATDNAAFEFAVQYRPELFPDAAIVFCGVNGFTDAMLAGQKMITGVVEDLDVSGTIDLAVQFHPTARQMVIVTDASASARAIRRQIEQGIPRYITRLHFSFLEDFTVDEVVNTVRTLPRDSIILLSEFNRDRNGRLFSPEEAVSIISKAAPVPTYSLWSMSLGKGIVGGKLLSGVVQGRFAGTMAAQLMKGTDISELPIIRQSPTSPMFDYNQLIRFNISPVLVPEGSRIINEPVLQVERKTATVVIFAVLLLVLITLALLVSILNRRSIERKLRLSEEKFSKAFHSSPDWFTISTLADGRYLEVNDGFLRATGYDRKEVIGKSALELGIWADPQERQAMVDALTHLGTMKNQHVKFRTKSGDIVTMLRSSELITIDNTPCTISIGRDITEYKRMEEQLHKAQKLESLGTLTGGIAHDFNNMLTAIIGYGDLLGLKLGEQHPQRAYVDQILSTAKKATSLTQSLLSFGKRQHLEMEKASLNDIVLNMKNLLRRIMREDIEIRLLLSDEPLIGHINTGQMEQLMINLATNASDAMPNGGVFAIATKPGTIDAPFIQAHGFGKEGKYAVLSLSDNGIGMDEKTRERIFEPFFTTKGTVKGTGLGLAMVYGIVKQHDGFIHVYSEPGAGTTFKIYLPLSLDQVLAETISSTVVAPVGGRETILVAEDDEHVRNLMRELLTEYGYTVIEATDGQIAVDRFRAHREEIDLVILDVIMPKKNGREAFSAIRALNPAVKCIFVSGYTDDIIDQRSILEEGLTFVSKPVTPTDILRRIREVLQERH